MPEIKNEFSITLETTCSLMRQALKDHTYYTDRLREMDALTQDYLHDLELNGLNYDGRAKVATKLQQCRQERRSCKDYVQSLTPLVDLLNSDRGKQFLNMLNEVIGRTRKIESIRKVRTYHRKVAVAGADKTTCFKQYGYSPTDTSVSKIPLPTGGANGTKAK